MPPRLFISLPTPLVSELELDLPEGASRHVQVLRLQPGEAVTLFDGRGGQWAAVVVEMGRKVVRVRVETHEQTNRELPIQITLAVGMPANDRMDALVEKATELGVFAIQPLMCERAVLRLDGERAAKKVAHWQGVAIAAAEQSGRTAVPVIHPVSTLANWIKQDWVSTARCGLLSLRQATSIQAWGQFAIPEQSSSEASQTCMQSVYFLSGPEGGVAPGEEDLAIQLGWSPVSLGPRVLRADTAPLAALSVLAALCDQ